MLEPVMAYPVRNYQTASIRTTIRPPTLIYVFNESDGKENLIHIPLKQMSLLVKDSPYRHDLLYVIDQKNFIKLDWLIALLNMGVASYAGAIQPKYANPSYDYMNHAYLIGFP